MYMLVILIWVLVAIAAGYGIVSAGTRTTFALIAWYKSKQDRQESVPVGTNKPLSYSDSNSSSNADSEIESSLNDDEQIKEKILKKEYESVNIGGAVVLVQTAPGFPKEETAVIFNQIKDKQALVNLALEGKVKIEEVNLITVNPSPSQREFAVSMILKNQTNEEIKVKIPKGQIFENKRALPKKQNLATVDEDIVLLPASLYPDSPGVLIKIKAFCLNKGLELPNGGRGNITIFELSNKSFISQNDLWEWIEDKLDKPNSR